MPLSLKNYILLLAGLIVIILGFVLVLGRQIDLVGAFVARTRDFDVDHALHGYALFSYAKHNGIFGMNIYHVPITPILAMILLVGLLQIVLSLVLSSNLKKETLVERIRYQG